MAVVAAAADAAVLVQHVGRIAAVVVDKPAVAEVELAGVAVEVVVAVAAVVVVAERYKLRIELAGCAAAFEEAHRHPIGLALAFAVGPNKVV